MRYAALVCSSLAVFSSTAGAQEAPAPRRDAAQVSRDGTFLPLTLTPRIGDQRVVAIVTGGYDSTAAMDGVVAGPTFTAVVEGALWNRVALRVGVDLLPNDVGGPGTADNWNPSVGLRVALLRQEQHGIDLGIAAMYKNAGFSEPDGELEFIVSIGRRWDRFGLFGNVAFGQGVKDIGDRDGEARLALLYAVHERVNIGLDVRGRVDLGEDMPGPVDALQASFDVLAGPVASVAVGPLAFLAQVGAHTLNHADHQYTGLVASGGVGASF